MTIFELIKRMEKQGCREFTIRVSEDEPHVMLNYYTPDKNYGTQILLNRRDLILQKVALIHDDIRRQLLDTIDRGQYEKLFDDNGD